MNFGVRSASNLNVVKRTSAKIENACSLLAVFLFRVAKARQFARVASWLLRLQRYSLFENPNNLTLVAVRTHNLFPFGLSLAREFLDNLVI